MNPLLRQLSGLLVLVSAIAVCGAISGNHRVSRTRALNKHASDSFQVISDNHGAPDDAKISFALGYRMRINQTSERSLALIPGIGPKLARKIIVHRGSRKAYRNFDVLLQIRGIGPKRLKIMKRYLRLDHDRRID